MRQNIALGSTLIASLVLLGGCATSQALRGQANHSASLVSQLETELTEFRRVRQISTEARAEAISELNRDVALVVSSASFDTEVRTAMGDGAPGKLSARLITLTDSLAKDERKQDEVLGKLDARLAELLKPLPSTTKASTAAQEAIVKLGEDMDWKTQFDELRAFYTEVEKSVNSNREKIREAEEPVE